MVSPPVSIVGMEACVHGALAEKARRGVVDGVKAVVGTLQMLVRCRFRPNADICQATC